MENDICTIPGTGGTGGAGGAGGARNLTGDWSLGPSSPAWSADGKTIYFYAETNGNVHLFAVAVTGGPIRQVTTGERQLRGFSLSIDGRSLAYTASDITHGTELYVTPLARSADRRLTTFHDSLFKHVTLIPADPFWFSGDG